MVVDLEISFRRMPSHFLDGVPTVASSSLFASRNTVTDRLVAGSSPVSPVSPPSPPSKKGLAVDVKMSCRLVGRWPLAPLDDITVTYGISVTYMASHAAIFLRNSWRMWPELPYPCQMTRIPSIDRGVILGWRCFNFNGRPLPLRHTTPNRLNRPTVSDSDPVKGAFQGAR
jgi:hypothetical protein